MACSWIVFQDDAPKALKDNDWDGITWPVFERATVYILTTVVKKKIMRDEAPVKSLL